MIWLTLDLGLALAASVHILLHKRQPRSALLWLLWSWLLPWLGALLYFYFGVNRVGRPAHRPVPGPRAGRRPALDALAEAVAGTPLRRGNAFRLLVDGTEAYPAMLASIDAARRSVDLESYIFDLDLAGLAFEAALGRAARRGARVRVLLDGMGALGATRRLRKGLRQAGVEVRSYWRLDRLFRQPLLNLRNHRKLLVVDGREAFVGGLNVSARYAKGPLARWRQYRRRTRGTPPLRDLHFGVRGPLLADLAASFERDWGEAEGPGRLLGPAPLRPAGSGRGWVGGVAARVVRSGPDQDLEKIYEVLLGALQLARREVLLCTPYFIPDAPLLAVLRSLGYRGVSVRLLVPRACDHPWLHWASEEYYRELLDAGVEIWEMGGSFVHSKLALVDGDWVFLGSSNLDPRSFRLNFELNVEARSAALAARARAVLEVYRRGATRISAEALRRRPAWQRLRGALVNLAAPYL